MRLYNWVGQFVDLNVFGSELRHTETYHAQSVPLKAALSLQAAAQRYASGSGARVDITSACEINKACQDVLKKTYSDEQCIFPDITKVNMKKKFCFCVRHQRQCELQPDAFEGST